MTRPDSPARRRLVRPRFLAMLGLVAVLATTVTVTVVRATDDAAQRRREKYENLKILSEVYDRILENYVDVLDAKDIMEAGVQGMLDKLDEHSNYLPPVNYEDLVMSTEGEFGGLGISINIRDHFPTVVSPIEGTPAYYMGIQGGDQIIEIEGESTRDHTSQQAVEKLRGPRGTKVNITVRRPGEDEPIPYTITRDIIKLESVPYAFMMDDIGYIRVQNFARTTASEMREKLDVLTAEGMKGLIVDLRFNPGGLLGAAQAVAELFLPRDQLIVFTKGRLAEQDQSYYSRARGDLYNKVPIIVLVNNSSASASEIVAAAIQDHDAGLVVGRTSFGKGSVQTVFRLDDDEALKLTTARYYTPSGRSIHREQRPEAAEDADTPEGHPDLAQEPAELEVPRSQKEVFHTDSGRVVYGGGGVTPDIEIKQDFMTDFEVAVERDNALFSWAVEYANAHPEAPRDWTPSDADYAAFKGFLKDRENIDEYLGVFELAWSDSLVDANRPFVERGLRREVARRLYGQQAAYEVAIEADVQLHEALKLFREARTLPEMFAVAAKWNEEHLKELADEEAARTAAAAETTDAKQRDARAPKTKAN